MWYLTFSLSSLQILVPHTCFLYCCCAVEACFFFSSVCLCLFFIYSPTSAGMCVVCSEMIILCASAVLYLKITFDIVLLLNFPSPFYQCDQIMQRYFFISGLQQLIMTSSSRRNSTCRWLFLKTPCIMWLLILLLIDLNILLQAWSLFSYWHCLKALNNILTQEDILRICSLYNCFLHGGIFYYHLLLLCSFNHSWTVNCVNSCLLVNNGS